MIPRPSRPWTDAEVELLKKCAEEGMAVSNICTLLGRSVPAVEAKYGKVRRKAFMRALVRTIEDDGPLKPEGFKVTPERLHELMAGRRFEDDPMIKPSKGLAVRITAPTYVPGEASC
jgi:hypothetical protein